MDYATALRQGLPGSQSGPGPQTIPGLGTFRPGESWDSSLKRQGADFVERSVDGLGLQPFLDMGPHAMTLARGLKEMAFPPAAADSAPGPLQELFAQKAELSQRRAAAEAARNAEGKTGKGPNWQKADAEVSRIDAQIAGVDQIIAEEQKKSSPEFALKMDEERRQAKERAAKEELDKPFAARHPMVASGLALGAPLASLALSRFGLGKIASKGESLMAELLKARKTGDVPGLAEATAKLGAWQKTALPKQAAAVAVPATIPADVRVAGDVIDRYSLPDSSEAQQKAEAKLSDVPKYAMDAIPGLAQGLVFSGIGAKIAKAAPTGDAKALTSLYGGKDQPTLATILKQGDRASAEVRALRRDPLGEKAAGSDRLPTRLEPESAPAIEASSTSTLPALPAAAPTGRGLPTTSPGTSPQGMAGSGAGPSSAPSLSSELSKRAMGGSSPDHNWNAKANRWQDVNGKFLPGKAPKGDK
jgi:hypothetical protein